MILAGMCKNGYKQLSEYAKQMGVRYETAWCWFRDGNIQGQRIGSHTNIISDGERRLKRRRSAWRCTAQHVFAWSAQPRALAATGAISTNQ
jgi:hypothetical protein